MKLYEISDEQLKQVATLISKSSGASYGEAYNIIQMLQSLKEIKETKEKIKKD